MATALAGLFTEYELTFQVPGDYTARDPVTGNVVPGASTPVTTRCWLKASKDPALQQSVKSTIDQLGQDKTTMVLRGRLVEPAALPASLKVGMAAPLSISGQPGTFHLEVSPPGLLPEVEAELGQVIAGVWVAH